MPPAGPKVPGPLLPLAPLLRDRWLSCTLKCPIARAWTRPTPRRYGAIAAAPTAWHGASDARGPVCSSAGALLSAAGSGLLSRGQRSQQQHWPHRSPSRGHGHGQGAQRQAAGSRLRERHGALPARWMGQHVCLLMSAVRRQVLSWPAQHRRRIGLTCRRLAGAQVRLWSVDSGECIVSLKGHKVRRPLVPAAGKQPPRRLALAPPDSAGTRCWQPSGATDAPTSACLCNVASTLPPPEPGAETCRARSRPTCGSVPACPAITPHAPPLPPLLLRLP
jgi:hypothetical protein